MTIRADIVQIFASNRKLDKRIDALVEYVEGYCKPIHDAYPRNTHVAVETVDIYGLVIDVDANGHAAQVNFPYGAYTE